MAKSEMKRVRVSVPANDAAVLAWLDAQVNVSASVRELIRREVRSSGVADVFASDVPEEGAPKRKRRQGRPAGTRNGDYATAAPEPAVQHVPVQQPVQQSVPQPQPVAQPVFTTKVTRSKRKAPARTGGGIQLSADSLGEFGVELDIDGPDDGGAGVQDAGDMLDEIAKMVDA